MPQEGYWLMDETLQRWSHRDLSFVVKTLVPERSDPEHVVDLLQNDEALLDAMIEDDRLFQQLMADDEILLSVSPQFFFKVLLLRTRRDLEQELYTIERRHQQKVVIFDAHQVVDLLSRPDVCDYLAMMLASYSRINSVTIPIRVSPGVWRRIRINDLDVDSLIAYAEILDEEHRFWVYQRIADACLLLTGVFPEYIESQQRYPLSGQPRLRLRSSLVHSLEDFESYGQAFYRLAADHRVACLRGQNEVLVTLSKEFILAEKPLGFLAKRYLALRKHRLFAGGSLSS
jgi:hypothetical protein